MKRFSNLFVRATGMMALVLAFAVSAQAGSRTLSMPNYVANPGTFLEVPLSLDNAAGLAALRVQINFNPEVLKLLAVTAGPLGEAFEMSQGEGEGFMQIVFARAESMVSGSGRLATLRFLVNAGAVQDLFSELAIADVNLSDSTGVVDLRQKDTLTITNGQLAVTLSPNIDNAQNGLPDWWETIHGMNLFGANANLDPEHDGMTNFLEYAFGGNPAVADAQARGIQAETITEGPQKFLSLGFYRRLGDASLLFHVQESPDLSLWGDLNLSSQTLGTPQNMGDGTEFVSVRGTIPVAGLGAAPKGFLQLKVGRP
jgi:hypothetical protein